MQPDLSGTVMRDRYRLLDVVGQGRFGAVYLARDLKTNVIYAVKVLHRAVAAEGRFLQRFQREAQILQRLDSPFVVHLYDFGQQDGLNYIVMEYVQGVTLARTIADRERISPSDATEIVRQVATGLSATARAAIVHRDIKPANLIVGSNGIVKLADFGIARGLDSANVTGTDFIGTAFYSAPEQANGEVVDGRADIYSLGVVLYEMLTGRLVFDGDTPLSVALKHLYEPVPSIRRIAPDVPEDVAAVVYRCLEKRPEHRFQTPEDLLEAIIPIQREFGLQRPDPESLALLHDRAVGLHSRHDWRSLLDLCGELGDRYPGLPEIAEFRRKAEALRLASQDSSGDALAGDRAQSPVDRDGLRPIDRGVVAVSRSPQASQRSGLAGVEGAPRGAFYLDVPGEGSLVAPDGPAALTIGREAPKSGVHPNLDLGVFSGRHSVSKQHALFAQRDGQWHLQDVASRNGTFVNGIRLEPGVLMPLADGDELTFGAVHAVFRREQQ